MSLCAVSPGQVELVHQVPALTVHGAAEPSKPPLTMGFGKGGEGGGRGRRMRRRGGETAYLVDVGLMSPGPDVLLAELHRRIPARVP